MGDNLDPLKYICQGEVDLVHYLLTAVSQLQYRAHQAGMSHLSFELHAEPPILYDIAHEIANIIPGDQTWRRMRYDEMMTEHRLYIYGDFIALKEHMEPYVFLVVTHFSGNPINWQNEHGRWIMRAPWLSAQLELNYDTRK